MKVLGVIDPGTQLGKYRFIRELGRGSMGIVYLAEDVNLHRQVAVKVLSASLSMDPAFRRRFLLEARSIAALSHPHIVRVHAFEPLDDYLAIEMELVERGSLADLMETKGVTLGELTRLAHQILDALQCCHEVGLVHRDIKPTNILLDSRGNAKLTDFGLAKILGSHLEASMHSIHSSAFFLGTPRYAPPESWDGQDAVPAWDFYSLGMVMYQAVTGHTPYEATTPMALVKEMATRKIPLLGETAPHVSPELAGLVDRMIAHDPANRPASAQEAIETLRSVPEFTTPLDVRAPTVVARRTGSPSYVDTVVQRVRRIRWRIYHGFALGVLLTLLAVGLWWPRHPEDSPTALAPGQPLSPPAPLPRQDTETWDALIDAQQLPMFTKNGEKAFEIYDVWLLQSNEKHPAAWMMEETPGKDRESRAFAAMGSTLWYLRLYLEEETIRIEGNWAQYVGPAGSLLRMGTITGSAQWLADDTSLLANLEFVDEQDNVKRSMTISVDRPPETTTDTGFLLNLERQPMIQPLLYNELIPRNLSWAKNVESLLPALANARTKVPFADIRDDGYEPDGKLDDPHWLQSFADSAGPLGVLMGVPHRSRARLMLRCGETGLHLGISLPQAPDRDLGLALALRRQASIPQTHSPWWKVTYMPIEGLSAIYTVGNRVQPWNCRWRFATAVQDEKWEAEAFLPFDNMGGADSRPSEEWWRLNCAVLDLDNPAGPVPVVEWGYPNLDDVCHGAILEIAFARAGRG